MGTISFLSLIKKIKNKTLKRGFKLSLLFTILSIFFGCATPSPKITQDQTDNFLIIGTGSTRGVYYPTGGALCKIINMKRNIHGLNCSVEPTEGSIFNINSVIAGELDFGMTLSDLQYHAVNGTPFSEWSGNPQKDLRAVFSIYSESLTLVAAVDAGIKEISDLPGKSVNIGYSDSVQRQMSIDALTAAGIDYNKDIKSMSAWAGKSSYMLQNWKVDAFFYTTGHPSGFIEGATSGKRKVRFIPITNVGSLIEKYPFYAKATIPVNYYPKAYNKENICSFGVKSTFVTSAKVPDEIVYTFTKEIFENFSEFKKLHPAYQLVTKESMLEGLSAPIHPGALRYYKEVGLK